MVPSYKDVEGFTKPTNLKQIKKEEIKGAANVSQDSGQVVDPEIEKYPTKFDYQKYFGRKIIVDEMIESGRASALHPVSEVISLNFIEIFSFNKLQKDVTQ